MSGSTPRLGLKTPVDSDPFLTSDFVTNYETIDSYPGVFVCTSTTLPSWASAQAGQIAFCTDTRTALEWSGTAWHDPLAVPSAWSVSAFINTAVSSSSATLFGIGSFTSTRAGQALVFAQLSAQPLDVRYAWTLEYRVQVNGSDVGALGDFGQQGVNPSTFGGASIGGTLIAPTCFGVASVVAGSNSVALSAYFQEVGAGGAPATTLTLGTGRLALIMANTVDT